MQPADLAAGAAQPGSSQPMATADYLPIEQAEEVKCAEMFEVIRKYEVSRSINLQARAALRPRKSTSSACAGTSSPSRPRQCCLKRQSQYVVHLSMAREGSQQRHGGILSWRSLHYWR